MKKVQLSQPPRFLDHYLLLRPDCLARLTLPSNLSRQEVVRLTALLDAQIVEVGEEDEFQTWPFPTGTEANGNLDTDEEDEFGDLGDENGPSDGATP